jgi:maltose O-acetyltransferase
MSADNIRIANGMNVALGNRIWAAGDCEMIDGGPVKIGEDVLLGSGVRIEALVEKPVTIGPRVWIGDGASIRPGVNVGEGAMVCSSSVVESDVPAYAVVEGAPARVTWRLR